MLLAKLNFNKIILHLVILITSLSFAIYLGNALNGLLFLTILTFIIIFAFEEKNDFGIFSPKRFFLLIYFGYAIIPFWTIIFRNTSFYKSRYSALVDIFHSYINKPFVPLVLILLGLIAFEIGYRMKTSAKEIKIQPADKKSLLVASVLFFLFCSYFFVKLVIFVLSQFSEFSFLNYSQLYGLLNAPTYLVGLGLGWFSISVIILLITSNIIIKNHFLYYLSVITLTLFFLFLIIMGKRRIALTTLLSLFLFRHYYVKRISKYGVAALFVAGVWLVNFVANLRILNIVGKNYLGKLLEVLKSLNPIEAILNLAVISEFQVPFGTFLTIVQKYPFWENFLIGKTYFLMPTVFIPHSIFPERWNGLAPWFVEHFFPIYKGTGFAFFILNEPYMNFGVLGIIVFMFFFGWAVKWISCELTKNKNNPFVLLVFAYVVSYMFSFIRSDLICIRELLYTFIFPILFVIILSHIISKINENIIHR